jgi:hypothetical protein
MPFFGVGTPPSLCSRRPHWTFIPLSPSCRAISQVETRCLRSRCSMPLFGVGTPPTLYALAVHIGRLYRSRNRAGQSFKTRRARWRLFKSRRACCALVVLDALFGVGPPPSLCSRRPHRTLVPLSPSCKAIVQVETRCLRSRCSMPFSRRWPPLPPLCSRRPHRTFIPLSPSCKAIIQVEMLSLCAHGSRYPLWRRTAAVAELSPST